MDPAELREVDALRQAFAVDKERGRQLSRRTVPRLVRRLRALRPEDRVPRAAALWALLAAAELDPLSRELMLRHGLPGFLVELQRSRPTDAESHYASRLSQILR